MSYTKEAQEYIGSVDGTAHMSAVEIIDRLSKENQELKSLNKELFGLCVKIKNDSNWFDWAFGPPDELRQGELESVIQKAEELTRRKQ